MSCRSGCFKAAALARVRPTCGPFRTRAAHLGSPICTDPRACNAFATRSNALVLVQGLVLVSVDNAADQQAWPAQAQVRWVHRKRRQSLLTALQACDFCRAISMPGV